MREALGPGPFELFVDLGTGTGRVLELFRDRFQRALGIDVNQAMLAYARAKLKAAGLATAQVRHGDIYALPLADRVADGIAMHQVLHFLANPALAIAEAARVLAPGGKLVIVDFAPHDLEFLRDEQAHTRLGLSEGQVRQWLVEAGLKPLEVRKLAPREVPGQEKLTVLLWLAERTPAAPARAHRKSKSLEETR